MRLKAVKAALGAEDDAAPDAHSVAPSSTVRRRLVAFPPGPIEFVRVQSPLRAADTFDVHFFWNVGCPHYRDMATSMHAAVGEDRDVVVHRHAVSHDADGAREFARTVEKLDLSRVVPSS